jgi:tRNA/tmRNA/rRNA uracil-C5-methylase (TrmA/RlmC/RlmD family)
VRVRDGRAGEDGIVTVTVDAPDWTDRVLDLQVGAVAHGGHCVARVRVDDGRERVVFVRHALPGERVRAVVTDDGGGAFCRADTITVLEPAPGRVEQPCPWARAGGCGGCDWQHADEPTQRALKTAVLREQLQRLAGVELDVVVEELPGGLLGWRHRVRLAVDAEGEAGLRAHRSHDVLPIADCPLVPAGELPPVLEQRFVPGDEVEVAIDADGIRHLHPVGSRVSGPAVVQRAAGREWHLSAGTFWQVHPALAQTLADVVGQWAQVPSGGLAWDLYGGVGLFAAVLAGQVGPDGEVRVVESARQAVSDGRAALADLDQVHWTVGRVEHVLASLPGRPDVVVADPPRRGLGRATVEALCARTPARVVYVACDPAALARDVALFSARGYDLTALRAFDAFPMTHHMECVALFQPT